MITQVNTHVQYKTQFIRIIKNLNLYDDHNELSLNDQILYTRVFIISTAIALLILLSFTGIIPQTRLITVSLPSVNDFENLINIYATGVMCRCSQTSIPYSRAVSLNPRFHQVCSSDFVKEEWFSSLFNVNTSNYYPLDFRLMASAQFQVLSILCQTSRRAVVDALRGFHTKTMFSSNALSHDEFNSYIGKSIEQFQKKTLETFRSYNHFILSFIDQHRFICALRTNFYTRSVSGSNISVTFSAIYPQHIDLTQSSLMSNETCRCDRSNDCIYPAGIYNQTRSIVPNEVFSLDKLPLFIIPGFQVGCTPQNALFQSTLECLYNQPCLDIVISLTDALRTVAPLNISNSFTKFSPTTTIAVIFDNIMMDSWEISIDFATYFQACAPKVCSHSYVQRFFLVYMITTIASVFGGLTVILRFVSPLFVKFILRLCRQQVRMLENNERREPKSSLQGRMWSFFQQISQKAITLDLFKDTFTHVQLGVYSTRLYILLLIFGIYILIIYSTSIVVSEQIIIRNPSQDQFEYLHDVYSSVLECSCRNSSIPRSSFIFNEVQIHPFCTSSFVRDDRWFQYWTMKFLNGSIDPNPPFYWNDFRKNGWKFFNYVKILYFAQSKLECFYKESCVQMLIDQRLHGYENIYLPIDLSYITALNSNDGDFYKPDHPLEILASMGFVNEWIYIGNYTLYYDQCQPEICTYTIDNTLYLIARVNLIIGLIGGLNVLLRLLVPSLIKIIYLIYHLCYHRTRNIRLRWRMALTHIRDELYLINVYRRKSQVEYQHLATRIYIVLLVLSFINVSVFVRFQYRIVLISVDSPNETYFSHLHSHYSDSLSCPCTTITIPLINFASVSFETQEACSQIMSQPPLTIRLLPEDILWEQYGWNLIQPQMRTLFYRCMFSTLTSQAASATLINAGLTSVEALTSETFYVLFNSFINGIDKNSVISGDNIYKSISDILQANQFHNQYMTSWRIEFSNADESYILRNTPISLNNGNCYCPSGKSNCTKTVIYYNSISNSNVLPGFVIGCSIMDGLSQSTFECFYDNICANQLNTAFGHSFTKFNLGETQFPPTTPIGSILDEYSIVSSKFSANYSAYFQICAPSTCQYRYREENGVVYVFTTLLGLYGGLTAFLHIFVWYLLDFYRFIVNRSPCLLQRVHPST
ncbi:unnamed protein product [Rotaria sp. Silwood1]|nr:unnamed protein product [Rotaria sp. Silwood1]